MTTTNTNVSKAAGGIAGVIILGLNVANQIGGFAERRRNRKINEEMLENDRERTRAAKRASARSEEASDLSKMASNEQINYYQALYKREMGES